MIEKVSDVWKRENSHTASTRRQHKRTQKSTLFLFSCISLQTCKCDLGWGWIVHTHIKISMTLHCSKRFNYFGDGASKSVSSGDLKKIPPTSSPKIYLKLEINSTAVGVSQRHISPEWLLNLHNGKPYIHHFDEPFRVIVLIITHQRRSTLAGLRVSFVWDFTLSIQRGLDFVKPFYRYANCCALTVAERHVQAKVCAFMTELNCCVTCLLARTADKLAFLLRCWWLALYMK